MRSTLPLIVVMAVAGTLHAGVRDVQFVQVDLSTNVVTLQNLGTTSQSLDGYRLCTADDDQQLRYTSATGLNGRTLAAGEQLFVHWNNDAPADPSHVDINALGGFNAQPMGLGPFGMAIYWTTPFGTPANMGDYLQWTDDLTNPGNLMADARADEAEAGGLWTGVPDFIVTNPAAEMLVLNDLSGSELHGPTSYDVIDGVADCPQDLDGSGSVDFADILTVLSSWGPCLGCAADFDGDDLVGFGDLLAVLAAWGPCP